MEQRQSRVENMEGLNVLVTGANGFLGSWLCNSLKGNVYALKKEDIKHSMLDEKRVTILNGDVTNARFIEDAIKKHSIGMCVHLAAQTIVGEANKNPLPTIETNVMGTVNVLEASRKLGVKVVIASSDKAYGEQALPYVEGMPMKGLHPYDASKSCADLLAQTYYNTYGIPVAITRLANIFGPRDTNFSRIVPSASLAIAKEEKPIIRSDGSPVRQYIYVEDAVSGYMELIEKMNAGKCFGEAFNFGSTDPLSVYEMVKNIMKAASMQGEPIIKGERTKGEIQEQYLSSKKAKKMLGWKPAVSLEEGLKRTLAWYAKVFA